MPNHRFARNEESGDSANRNEGKIPKAFLLIIPALLAIGILLMFFVGKSGTHSNDLLYEDLENRIKRIEQRLSRIEQQAAPPVPRPVTPEKAAKPEPPAKSQPVEKENKLLFHEVAEGETLFKISRTYGVSLDDLRKWNNLPPEEGIRTGQKLRIGGP